MSQAFRVVKGKSVTGSTLKALPNNKKLGDLFKIIDVMEQLGF